LTSPKVIFKCKFYRTLENSNLKNSSSQKYINGMFNYFSDIEKRTINMFDYYTGKINHPTTNNLILENGKYATTEEIEKRKTDYLKYLEKSNLWLGIISFDNNYIDENIDLKTLEKKLATEVIPKFLKKCGFKDIKKMSYQLALHTNTDNYHFHISFIEKEKNFETSSKGIQHRRIGKLSSSEINFMKNEIIHTIERHREFTPLVISANKELEELKKFFKPSEKNFILKNTEDLILENNILELGKLLYEQRLNKNQKIKFNSLKNKEIISLTHNIKNYIFKNQNSSLFKQEELLNKTLVKINEYFYNLTENKKVKKQNFKSEYVTNKQKYLNNYIYNVIVNHALYKYSKITKNEIIQEAVLKTYNNCNIKNRYYILLNYLQTNNLITKNELERNLKNINYEMNIAANEFNKLFNYEIENNY